MPSIENLSPASGWPGGTRADGTRVDGTLVVITGRDFHPTPEMTRNRVSFAGENGTRVDAPVVWASPDEIHYTADTVIDDSNQIVGPTEAYIRGLDGLEGIAVFDGALYVAVTGQNTIKRGPDSWQQRFFPDVRRPNGRAADFIHPAGIAVDDDGNVYVANSGMHRIEVYGPFLLAPPGGGLAWGSQGSGDGEFNFPRAVDAATINGETFVFVADTYNQRVIRTRPDGTDFRVFAMPDGVGSIQGVAAHRAGDVYCSDPSNNRVLRFDADGNFIAEFGSAELDYPLGLDVDFDGFIYVADNGSRTVKKYDTDLRLIAEFGLTPSNVPTTTPPEELVDPVDVAVGDDKAVWIADRRRNHVVRWFPEDSQEIWFHVPEGAVSGALRIETDDGETETQFRVLQVGPVSVNDAIVTQGIEEYPFVAGKRTAILLRMATPLTPPPQADLVSFWGSPVTDTTEVRVVRDGVEQIVLTEFQILGADLSGVVEATFDLLIELPLIAVSEPGAYEFQIRLQRPGVLEFSSDIQRDVRRRRSVTIGAYVLSHLRPDGVQITSTDIPNDFFGIWLGDDTQTLSWLDQNTMLSGFAHFNRMFPSRHSLVDAFYLGVMPLSGLTDKVDADEQRHILRILEQVRQSLNEGDGLSYDYIIGIVSREFTTGQDAASFAGVTSPGDWHTAIVSFGRDEDDPVQDMGSVLAHEIGHQLGLVQAGPRFTGLSHSSNRFVQTRSPGWNGIDGFLVPSPISVMFVSDTDGSEQAGDSDGFFEQSFDGEPAADYQDLFDALANPHPPPTLRRDVRCDSGPDAPKRPAGSRANYTLMGTVDREGKAILTYSRIVSADTPVTPPTKSDYALVQVDERGRELLRWPVLVSFTMLATTAARRSESRETSIGAFRVTSPWIDVTTEVRLEVGGRVIDTVAVPRGDISIEILSPAGRGEQVGRFGFLMIRWRAEHSRNSALIYRVDYSADGSSWQLVQDGLTATELEFRGRPFPGSNAARVRVTATDGFQHASAVSPPFVVTAKPPRVNVLSPRSGQVFAEGQPIRLAAVATDAEDGVLGGKQILWTLDGRIPIGGGAERRIGTIAIPTPRGKLRRTLPPGAHTVTARAFDGDGMETQASVAFHVAADRDGDGYTDEEERASGTDPDDPLDHPGNLNAQPFGQWQLSRAGRWTRFEISNLTPRAATIEVAVIREGGQPLAKYPVPVQEGAAARNASTDQAGAFQLKLAPLASAMFELRADAAMDADALYGFSTTRLVRATGSRTATLLAHGWIRQEPAGAEPAAEGTVVIHGGAPFTLKAPLPPKRSFRPISPYRFDRIHDLGHLMRALSKGIPRDPALKVRGPRRRD
jgi:sugar lactone lactonase YvrE